LPGFGSAVFGPIEAAERAREEAERRAAEEARRAADPYSKIEDKISELAAGDHEMADLYAQECRQYFDETEALGDGS
jgi:hypothetical protein